MSNWKCLLRLDGRRNIVAGSVKDLAAAVSCGADLKGYTTFDYGEHMSVPGSREGLVQELMSFSTVYWLEGGHVAGIQTTRYPANCSLGFGETRSLSFFLNNENGQNGIARLFLDGSLGKAKPAVDHVGKYRVIDAWDVASPCPSENFTYDFGEYAWWVNDTWREALVHDAQGKVLRGSLYELQEAIRSGMGLKVGVRNLCAHLSVREAPIIGHEVFVELHSIYNHEKSGFLGGESQPLVRVVPAVPLRYESGNWNCGWILPRTDGIVHHLVLNPYTHEFSRSEGRCEMRWFVG